MPCRHIRMAHRSMATATMVQTVAVETVTDVKSNVVDTRKLQVIEDAGTEVDFDEGCFVKAVDSRHVKY